MDDYDETSASRVAVLSAWFRSFVVLLSCETKDEKMLARITCDHESQKLQIAPVQRESKRDAVDIAPRRVADGL